MAPMGQPMMARVGMPRAAMGHARPIALPMPAHVLAMVEAMRAHGMAHGDAMGNHRAGSSSIVTPAWDEALRRV